ncbi:N-acetylmuramic acid 6-phosphate etherase [Marinilactibacillus psychrotolerans]|nr:N-acetylmuramic acid 6-phosphate etherase [Marinilactibacillus psychrotolerans]
MKMIDLEKMTTEKQNEKSMELDTMTFKEALELMNEEDKHVINAVKDVIPQIEAAVDKTVKNFKRGGRLIYCGAGTSGRLGVLDASECPPTFGTSSELVVGLMAGGNEAFTNAVEGIEDSRAEGEKDLKKLNLSNKDTVIGLAASGRTPYVLGALAYANKVKASTISISCNKNSEIGQLSGINIEAVVGPEVLTGSTRLKAGTAQKLILNMISTVSMVGMGKVFKNLMVDVQSTNKKLQERSIRIVQLGAECPRDKAKKALEKCDYNVKLAIVSILLNIDKNLAEKTLENSEMYVRKALIDKK